MAWESMLQEIYIKNFVLIDELRMEFYQGLNALTGETGAGKSIIIDALGLIVGGRINNDFIRDEKQKAIVEAVFSLENNPDAQAFLSEKNLLEEDDENSLIICREISPGRRNAARINGHNVPLSLLKELSPHLIDMHLQHDHLNILRPAMFIHYVDQFIEDGNITEKITAIFNNWQKKQQQLKLLNENEQARLQQVDLLNFQINEIEKVNLVPDEEEELLALRNRVKNANKLAEDAAHLVQILYSDEALNIFDLLGQTVDIIKKNQDDNFFASIQSNFEDMYYNVQDLAREIMTYRDSLDFEPGKLEEIEDRLHIINRLKAKYGKDIKEVLYYLSNARLELQKFNNVGQVREEYEQEIAQLEREYNSLASCLTAARKKAADKLQANVEKE
ncbi:MAG: AAA family ATPase, partial [Syntrophomonadaceae bacterium]|nr:AAA family ATPase [Syntrophomonadaceae bacterium]